MKEDPVNGIVCPSCGCRHLPVDYTRRQGKIIKRRRVCRNCGRKITTEEKAKSDPE